MRQCLFRLQHAMAIVQDLSDPMTLIRTAEHLTIWECV